MSPPAPTAPRKSRWTDRLTAVLLAACVGVVAGSAAPAVLRAAGVELPSAAPPPSAAPLPLPHRPPDILAHENPDSLFDPDDDEAPFGHLGLTRDRLVLHEHPAGAAAGVGDVQAGEMVTILRVVGDWVLVYYGADGGGLVVGWAKKSEIAIR